MNLSLLNLMASTPYDSDFFDYFFTDDSWYDESWEPHLKSIFEYAESYTYEGDKLPYEQAVREIKENMLNWVKVGIIARLVKRFKLYKRHYKRFQDFCLQELGKGAWYVNRMIRGAEIVFKLVQAGFKVLPTCEAQTRPLANMCDDELVQSWGEVTQKLPPQIINQETITDVLNTGSPQANKNIKLPKAVWEKLMERAIDAGKSLEEYLAAIANGEDPEAIPPEPEPEEKKSPCPDEFTSTVEDIPPEKFQAWEADLEDLITQNDSDKVSKIGRMCTKLTKQWGSDPPKSDT